MQSEDNICEKHNLTINSLKIYTNNTCSKNAPTTRISRCIVLLDVNSFFINVNKQC